MRDPAFPTLHSPTASSQTRSMFDAFDIQSLQSISTNAQYGIYPVTEKKGRFRSCFLTAQSTLLEIHKSERDARDEKKREAGHVVPLVDVFNVCVQREPSRLKADVLCVMDPNETFFFLPSDSEHSLGAWHDWILERTRECRSNKLLRPVFIEEFFEVAWDVVVVQKPKLKKGGSAKKQQQQDQMASGMLDDLVKKRPQLEGRKRLCICSNSFLLFNMGSRPTSDLDIPFNKMDFVDLPLNVISSYGTQEKYFFIRIGRHSEIGSGELWMCVEHGMEAAKAMHERISEINLREADRRRTQGVKVNIPTVSASVLKSKQHRERSQTQNQRRGGTRTGSGAGHKQSTVLAPLKEIEDVIDANTGNGGTIHPGDPCSSKRAPQTSTWRQGENFKAVTNGSSSARHPKSPSLTPSETLFAQQPLQSNANIGVMSPENTVNCKPAKKSLTGFLASKLGRVSLSAQSSPLTKRGSSNFKGTESPLESPTTSGGSARSSLINNILHGFGRHPRQHSLASPQENAKSSAGHSPADENSRKNLSMPQAPSSPRQNAPRGSTGGQNSPRHKISIVTSPGSPASNMLGTEGGCVGPISEEDYMPYDPRNSNVCGIEGFAGGPVGGAAVGLGGQSGSLGSHSSAGGGPMPRKTAGSLGSSQAGTGILHHFSSVSTTFTALPDSRKSSACAYEYMMRCTADSIASNTLTPGARQNVYNATSNDSRPRSRVLNSASNKSSQQQTSRGDYMAMDRNISVAGGVPTNDDPVFPLQEVHSYISNSTESCCLTPPGSNQTVPMSLQSDNDSDIPRAYSLGARPYCQQQQQQKQYGVGGSGEQLTVVKQSPPSLLRLLQPSSSSSYHHQQQRVRSRAGTLAEPPSRAITSKTHSSKSPEKNQPPLSVPEPPFAIGTELMTNAPVEMSGPPTPGGDTTTNSSSPIQQQQQSGKTISGGTTTTTSSATDRALEMRKRAHSHGSKLMRPSLRKKKLMASIANNQSSIRDGVQRKRAGSDAGTGSDSLDPAIPSFQSPNCSSVFSRSSHSDHVEIDFDRDSYCRDSMDSLATTSCTSRHSSLGTSSGIRASLDLALTSHRMRKHSQQSHQHQTSFDKPSDRLIRSQQRHQQLGGRKGSPSAIARKRSVPEMLQKQSHKSTVTPSQHQFQPPQQQSDHNHHHHHIVRQHQVVIEELSPSASSSPQNLSPNITTNDIIDKANNLDRVVERPEMNVMKMNDTSCSTPITIANKMETVLSSSVIASPKKIASKKHFPLNSSNSNNVDGNKKDDDDDYLEMRCPTSTIAGTSTTCTVVASLNTSRSAGHFQPQNRQQQPTSGGHLMPRNFTANTPIMTTPSAIPQSALTTASQYGSSNDDYGIILPMKKTSTSSLTGVPSGNLTAFRGRRETATCGAPPDASTASWHSLSPIARGRSPTAGSAASRRAGSGSGSVSPRIYAGGGGSPLAVHRHGPLLMGGHGSRCGSFSQSSSPVMSLKRRVQEHQESRDISVLAAPLSSAWFLGARRKFSKEVSSGTNARKHSSASASGGGVGSAEKSAVPVQMMEKLRERHNRKQQQQSLIQRGDTLLLQQQQYHQQQLSADHCEYDVYASGGAITNLISPSYQQQTSSMPQQMKFLVSPTSISKQPHPLAFASASSSSTVPNVGVDGKNQQMLGTDNIYGGKARSGTTTDYAFVQVQSASTSPRSSEGAGSGISPQ